MDLSRSSCLANNTGQGTKGHFLKDMDSVTHFQEGERQVKFKWSVFELLGTGRGKATQVKRGLPAGGLLAYGAQGPTERWEIISVPKVRVRPSP